MNHQDMSTICLTIGEKKTSGLRGGTLSRSVKYTAKGRDWKTRHGERGPSRNTTLQPYRPRRLIGMLVK